MQRLRQTSAVVMLVGGNSFSLEAACTSSRCLGGGGREESKTGQVKACGHMQLPEHMLSHPLYGVMGYLIRLDTPLS